MKNKRINLNLYDVIRYPVLTEKSNLMTEGNQYFFAVAKDANKGDIKQAVELVFDVKVKSVNTLIRKGKTRTFRGRKGRQSDVKRAMVSLESGQIIDFSSGV
ncbi:MAG: 50S ribosomal protein L23 [Alphaproteobacteria bacterium]|nr:50S ribosomal protein L23 [Alphaproteobacteria bacterium]